jgi:hypothetical protein
MTGYLTQLAARSLSLGDTVRPRVAAIFEPVVPAAEWPPSAGEPDADQTRPSPAPSGQPLPGTGRLEARAERPVSRRSAPAGDPPGGRTAEQPGRLPAPRETETSEPPPPTAPRAASAAPSHAGRAVGRRTHAAQPSRRGTRETGAPPPDRPLRAGSGTRVSPPGQQAIPAGEHLAQPPVGDLVAPAREAPAVADGAAFHSQERGAGSIAVPGAAQGPAVSAAQGRPDDDTDHLPAAVAVWTRRSHRTELTTASDPSQPTETVQVTIGRVEVRAVTAPGPGTRPGRDRRPMVTLAEHLQAREATR